MSQHVLFVIHGMGVHPAAGGSTGPWIDSIRDKLVECAGRYSYFKTRPLLERVHIVPLSFDAEIGQAYERWSDDPRGIVEHARGKGLDPGWIEFLASIPTGDEGGFVWTHVGDVLVYRLFALERQNIRVQICDQIVTAIEKRTGPDGSLPSASVLAHSLGTSVLHDSLCLLSKNVPTLFPPHWRFQSLFMLANVGRALQSDFIAFESVVRPGPANMKESCCNRFVNALHKYDPFTLVRRFDPGNWGALYTLLEPEHFRAIDVHGFEHYLDHPTVHIRLFNQIVRNDAISAEEAGKAVDEANYPRFGGEFPSLTPQQRAWLDELFGLRNQVPADPDFLEYMKLVVRALSLVWKLRQSLP